MPPLPTPEQNEWHAVKWAAIVGVGCGGFIGITDIIAGTNAGETSGNPLLSSPFSIAAVTFFWVWAAIHIGRWLVSIMNKRPPR